jgi:hypothetical protein
MDSIPSGRSRIGRALRAATATTLLALAVGAVAGCPPGSTPPPPVPPPPLPNLIECTVTCSGTFHWRTYQDSGVTIGTCVVDNQMPIVVDDRPFTGRMCVAAGTTAEQAQAMCAERFTNPSAFQASVRGIALGMLVSGQSICAESWSPSAVCTPMTGTGAPRYTVGGCSR